jgi:ribonucleoside-diphosphate reductase alpha chain
MTRQKLPSRRAHWTQKVKIENSTYYLCVGEYPDGRPGEIWLEAHKMGTFARGVLDSLARMASIALQCGAGIEDVIKAFQGMCFPPNGEVTGERTDVVEVTSIVDWVAQELSNKYLKAKEPITDSEPNTIPIRDKDEPDPAPPEKIAGYTSNSVWS